MSVTVPTWTVALPLVLLIASGLAFAIWWADRRWVTPWIDRKLAKRWGISVEEINAAREELHKRGEW